MWHNKQNNPSCDQHCSNVQFHFQRFARHVAVEANETVKETARQYIWGRLVSLVTGEKGKVPLKRTAHSKWKTNTLNFEKVKELIK